ncbi:hypothetical protein QAD02_017910 [Eretmocerus hayati]|uniref:Uncharacterized protein n=1 Tax=Eretmocerus hayati TaxID=131215 RepID=A0ACC2PF98_9HYME|nr:hypothetical protein QAD02_017910 [Eretmocerus hayati]
MNTQRHSLLRVAAVKSLLGVLFGALVMIILLDQPGFGIACNEAECASVVSKCMLTQSCKCDLVNCSCCTECSNCLAKQFIECCSCVDLCPPPNKTDNPLSKKSHVEEFNEPVPGLFQALTAEPDPHERWISYTYPIDIDPGLFSPKQEKETKYQMLSELAEKNELKPNVLTLNCTVAYMASCSSWNKCKQACQSMGAASYRWFHDGCCECVGNTCINYGINEPRCLHCHADDLGETYDDYGQDDDELLEDEKD